MEGRSGVIDSIDVDRRGDTLAAAVAAVDTVLVVTDTADFNEGIDDDGGWLVIGDDTAPLRYLAADDDTNTITLAAPAGAVYEAGLPVVVWDPTVKPRGARVVEYEVQVITDRGPVSATLPHEKAPFAGVDLLVGASVTLAEDDRGDWFVDQILGRTPRAAIAGAFATDTGFDDIEIIPGDDTTPAALRFNSDGEYYNRDDPAGISCFDEPGFGEDGTDFYVRFLGARAIGDGPNARPQVHLYTAYDATGTVSSVDLMSGGSDADFGFIRFFIKGTMKALVSADGLRVVDTLTAAAHVVFEDLASDGGSVDAGARYCRVGNDGRLYASANPPGSLQDILADFEDRISTLETKVAQHETRLDNYRDRIIALENP